MRLYIHIPFCAKKCNYCDFLSFTCDESTKSAYVNMLIKEINYYGNLYGRNGINTPVSSVFFGGGTPSILESKYIYSILTAAKDSFNIEENAEITIECNPGTVNLLKLSDYKACGINRLSIGLQSTNNSELLFLGRIHNFNSFLETYNDARKAGFDNINIDIMSALPGQTLDSYKDTLIKITDLEPEHISAYSLIIEEGTPFYDLYEPKSKPSISIPLLPDEDTERGMYYLTEELLNKKGYLRYEISNYSKPSFECKHNLGYWTRDDYLGIGLGSSSLIDNKRLKNISNLQQYMHFIDSNNFVNLIDETISLSKHDIYSEYMFLGLRIIGGIDINNFKKQFGIDIDTIYGGEILKLVHDELLIKSKNILKLSKKGIDVSNYVLSNFI